ncbi:MAG: hypothetical protein ACOCNC_05805 [Acetivibrio ethanolgignens]
MYLTKATINILDDIIVNLNEIENEEEKKKFLDEHVEDSDLLVSTLKKLNKRKMPKGSLRSKKSCEEIIETDLYKEEEVYNIFGQKDDREIMDEYSLAALKQMYISVYKRRPTSTYTKERIVSALRNRLHTMKRTAAFMKMAEQREKGASINKAEK